MAALVLSCDSMVSGLSPQSISAIVRLRKVSSLGHEPKFLRFMSHETKIYSVTLLENSSRVKGYGKGDEFHFETRVLYLSNG